MALLVRSEDERITVRDADLPGIADGDPETTYILRPMTRKVAREIEGRHRTLIVDRQTHQKVAHYEQEAIWLDKVDYVVLGWTGVLFSETREPVPCTREMKDLALDAARQIALLSVAGINEVSRDEREASFREPAPVLRVLGG